MRTQSAVSRIRGRVRAGQARRQLARELAAYRTPAERLELDLILGRHTAEQGREINEILRQQAAGERNNLHHALWVDPM